MAGLRGAVRARVRIYTEVAINRRIGQSVEFSKEKIRPWPVRSTQENHCHLPIGRWSRCYFRRALDTPAGRDHLFILRSSSRNVSASAEGIGDMQQLNSLLRSAPSRVGRRLALIFAIAAASLPAAGA